MNPKTMNAKTASGRRLSRVAAVAAGLSLIALGLGGCNNAASGGLTGAGLGAGSGAIIGSFTGSAGKGAIIGAVAGALGGAIIGDQNERRQQGR